MQLHNKVYQVRVNENVLKNALEYCNNNGLLLSEELRRVIERYDLRFRKEKKKREEWFLCNDEWFLFGIAKLDYH